MDVSQLFFATVQNKMHWAAHGRTAAEIVYQRANPEGGWPVSRQGREADEVITDIRKRL
jgi:hypothetical protein